MKDNLVDEMENTLSKEEGKMQKEDVQGGIPT